MTSEINKGHIKSFKNCKIIFNVIYIFFNVESFKTFQEFKHYEDTIFSLDAV